MFPVGFGHGRARRHLWMCRWCSQKIAPERISLRVFQSGCTYFFEGSPDRLRQVWCLFGCWVQLWCLWAMLGETICHRSHFCTRYNWRGLTPSARRSVNVRSSILVPFFNSAHFKISVSFCLISNPIPLRLARLPAMLIESPGCWSLSVTSLN